MEKKDSRNTLIKGIGAVITISTAIFSMFALTFGGYAFLDKRYALAINHKSLALKVEVNEVNGLHREAMKEVYFFKKQQRLHPEDYEITSKLKEAQEESDQLKTLTTKLKIEQRKLRSNNND